MGKQILIRVQHFLNKIGSILLFGSHTMFLSLNNGTPWRTCLKHCATSRKVADSFLEYVNGIFHLHNPSGRTMALGSTHLLTERSTRNISLGLELITLPPSCADCLEIWEP
jgi:hypothetical protein